MILPCRTLKKANETKQQILDLVGKEKEQLIIPMEMDLSSFASISRFVGEFKEKRLPLHYLINNAGVYLMKRELTEDGFEMDFGVNHLGHFLLTKLLTPILISSAPSQVIIVASDAHIFVSSVNLEDYNLTKDFDPGQAYGLSKLYNIFFCLELNKRLAGTGVIANCLHPGLIRTELTRHNSEEEAKAAIDNLSESFNLPILTIEQGAATTLYCLSAKEGGNGGVYFQECRASKPSKKFLSTDKYQKELWDLSEKLIASKISKL